MDPKPLNGSSVHFDVSKMM